MSKQPNLDAKKISNALRVALEVEHVGQGHHQVEPFAHDGAQGHLHGTGQLWHHSPQALHEKHLRLSEVESLEHLERYNNGFYRG